MTNISQQIDLGWKDAWMHEARGPHGEWIKGPGSGYELPDPSRLAAKGPFPQPSDHPFFKKYPVSPHNIIAAWDAATPDQKEQGMRWYADAHDLATAIGKTWLNGDTTKAAGLLAAFSPRTAWPINMFNAGRVAKAGTTEGFKGQATGDFLRNAQEALDGMDIDANMESPKINSFAHLINLGGDRPGDKLGEVVVDRHALDVATGASISDKEGEKAPIGKERYHEYVADQYRLAARALSDREGVPVSPHQVQAVTWLVRQAEAEAADRLAAEQGHLSAQDVRLMKGRVTRNRNAWRDWVGFAQKNGIPLQPTTFRVEPITAAEARGNSRPVSAAEFQRIAAQGLAELQRLSQNRQPTTGLDQNWASIKASTWNEVQKPWGGATIDAHTGKALPDGADRYALSVKPQGVSTVSVPETASQAEFNSAMDQALASFRDQLEQGQRYLGIFHDDENHRIDIDPVLVVDTPQEVEQVGAFTHAIGGAYHFKSGDGYWPPHVAATGTGLSWPTIRDQVSGAAPLTGISLGSPLISSQLSTAPPFLNPRQWQAMWEISLTSQTTTDLASDAWRHELRGRGGKWVRSISAQAADRWSDAARMPPKQQEMYGKLLAEYDDPSTSTLTQESISKAGAAFDAGDYSKAAEHLRDASLEADGAGHGDQANRLAAMAAEVGKWQSTMNDSSGPRGTTTALAKQMAPQIPDMLGGGREAWNGRVELFSKADNPAIAAEMRWDGSMGVEAGIARLIETTKDDPGRELQASHINAHLVILHELIHGDIAPGQEYEEHQQAYQIPANAKIEEGFTELGTIQHAADYLTKAGIGSRSTSMMAQDAQGRMMDNPDYERRVMAISAALDAEAHKIDQRVTGPVVPGGVNDQGVLRQLRSEMTSAIADGTYSRFYDAVQALKRSGDPEFQTTARKLEPQVNQLFGIPMSKHATAAEYADRMNDPVRIANQDAWGHYGPETAKALEWAKEVAKAEGLKKCDVKGSAGYKRVMELADEINQLGPADKVPQMAEQVVRAHGEPAKGLASPLDVETKGINASLTERHTPGIMADEDWQDLEDSIRDNWGRGGGSAFRNATAHRAAMAAERRRAS